jgi:hypothetical protein
MKRLVLASLIFLPCMAVAQTVHPRPPAARPRPSLDLLVTRVDEFWKLLLAKKMLQAAAYVRPSDRSKFSSGGISTFKEPRLKSLELSSDRTEATVTVVVKRIVVALRGEIEWPYINRWHFEKGNWYCRYESFNSILPSGNPNRATPEQVEAAKAEIRSRLRFEKTAFDFGRVDLGQKVVLSLKYSLTGGDPVSVTLQSRSFPDECCGIRRSIHMSPEEQKLLPGADQEMTVEVPTRDYDGAVNERFTLVAKVQNLEVPFEFSVQGYVYAPVSMIPRALRFKKGEREKQVVMRNNSHSDLQVKPAISETRQISIEPLPATIPAGQELKLTVRAGEALDSLVVETPDNVAITFVKPVDGMGGLSFRVIVNAQEENEKQKTAAPDADDQIRELIRQNKQRLPK